jgi:hypothetical protein
MPGQRPFQTQSLDSIFVLAKQHWDNVHFLQVILDELTERTTPAAKERRTEIGERVSALVSARQGESRAERFGDQDAAGELARLRAEKTAAHKRIDELERILRQAGDTIRVLKRDLSVAAARPGNPIFRRVGLDEGCPDFIVKAARTAYRKALHPDARPAPEKAEAESRFKEAESLFDAIYALRKL